MTADDVAAAVDVTLAMVEPREALERAREARRLMRELRAARDEAILRVVLRLHGEGLSPEGIAAVLQGKLLAGGMPEDRLRGAGVSHDTIRRLVERHGQG